MHTHIYIYLCVCVFMRRGVRYEGKPMSRERLDTCLLAAELGLFHGPTWQAMWSIEKQYGKGLSNSLLKLQKLLHCSGLPKSSPPSTPSGRKSV